MKKVLFLVASTLAFANENLIEFYTDQTIITQKFIDANSSFSAFVPEGVQSENITINGDCDANAYLKKISEENSQSYIKWKQEVVNLNNKLEALNARGRFIEQALIGENKSNDVTKRAEEFYKFSLENIEKISTAKSELEVLKENEPKSEMAGFLQLDMKFACSPKEATLSYMDDEAPKTLNEIYADTKNKNILIKQEILLTNPFANEVKNLKLAIYPTRYQKALAPNSFYPWYEESEVEADGYGASKNMLRAAKVAAEVTAEVADMRVQRDENEFAKIWKIDGINLAKGESKYITYDTQKMDANFSVFADFYGSLKAYNVASLKLNDDLTPAKTQFYVNGVSVGSPSEFEMKAKDEPVQLFLGQNDLIELKKERLNKFKKSSFLGKERISEEGYEISVKNNSRKSVDVTLVDRVPVSADEAVKVEIKGFDKKDISKEGKVELKFSLAPKEEFKKEYSYKITKPKI